MKTKFNFKNFISGFFKRQYIRKCIKKKAKFQKVRLERKRLRILTFGLYKGTIINKYLNDRDDLLKVKFNDDELLKKIKKAIDDDYDKKNQKLVKLNSKLIRDLNNAKANVERLKQKQNKLYEEIF